MEHSPNENNKVYLSFIRDEYFRNLDSLSGVSTPKQNHVFNTPRLLWTLKAGESHRLTTGLELVNEQLHFDMNPLGYDDLKSMNTGSLYVQDEIRSHKALSFTAGVRADWNNRFGWHVTPKVSVQIQCRQIHDPGVIMPTATATRLLKSCSWNLKFLRRRDLYHG